MTARPRPAVTLVEVLVVIAVIGILVGMMMMAVQSARAAAARVSCASNLRQVALAAMHFESVHQTLPSASDNPSGIAPAKFSGLTWPVVLLPYLEQQPLYDRVLAAMRTTIVTNKNPPHDPLTTVVKLYTCPADGRLAEPITDDKGFSAAYASYMGVGGGTTVNLGGGSYRGAGDGAMGDSGQAKRGVRLAAITDGTSSTLLIGERPPYGKYLDGNWYSIWTVFGPHSPYGVGVTSMEVADVSESHYACRGPFRYGPGRVENLCDSHHFWSLHPGGANFAFADGSVRFLPYSAEPIMVALATRAGGEVVELP